jgi:hypothetical protein
MFSPARAHADTYDVPCTGCGTVLRLVVTRLDVSEQLRAKGWICRGWGEHSCPDCIEAPGRTRRSSPSLTHAGSRSPHRPGGLGNFIARDLGKR